MASPTELLRDWRKRAADFKNEVCYRDERPLDVELLLADLDDDLRRAWVINDLRLLTGLDFTTATAAAAIAWWRSLAQRHARGVLLKWGHPQDLRALLVD